MIPDQQSPYRRAAADFENRHAPYYSDPSGAYLAPFAIADGLYYVGDRRVCIHLLSTKDGLLLIDSGYPHTLHLLTDAIYRLGFRPDDLRWILHTHEHFDHFGASREYKRLYGCKLAISAAGAAALREHPESALLSWSCNPSAQLPEFDRELQDGEIFRFGDAEIRCVLTPGHSPGVTSFFFDATFQGKRHRAGLFGGVGDITVYREHLERYGLPLSLQRQLLHSLDKVASEPVDLVLGNHPSQNRTVDKRERQLSEGGNPFIEPEEWSAFLLTKRRQFEQFIARGC